jgi:cell wall-associated NlpC family hydrolase
VRTAARVRVEGIPRQGKSLVTIAASQTSTALPSSMPDMTSLLASLQQAVESLSAVVAQLQAQAGTNGQAQAGAATVAGGGSSASGGCGCGGGMGAVAGVDQLGQADSEFSDAAGTGADAGIRASTAHVKQHESHAAHAAHAAPRAHSSPSGVAATSPGDDAGGGGGRGQQLVDFARQQLGKKYVYGAEGPDAFDCSGLIQYVAKHFGIDLPRVASAQAHAGRAVSKSDLRPGDLVYFQDKGAADVTHIGMYIGGGQYIHAPQPGENVKVGNLSDSYSKSTYKGARRIT